jgi:hypothetical protein
VARRRPFSAASANLRRNWERGDPLGARFLERPGINASATSTRRNAVIRAPPPGNRHQTGRRRQPRRDDHGHVRGGGHSDPGPAVADLQARRGGHGAATAAVPTRAFRGRRSPPIPLSRSPLSALIATSELPKPSPAAAPSMTPYCALTGSMRREKISSTPEAVAPPFEDDHRDHGVLGVVSGALARYGQGRELLRRSRPTRATELEPKKLRHHREEDKSARQHRLGEPERQKRERSDVREKGGSSERASRSSTTSLSAILGREASAPAWPPPPVAIRNARPRSSHDRERRG